MDIDGWNKGNVKAFDRLLSPKMVWHEVDIQSEIKGIEAHKTNVTIFRMMFPDFRVKLTDFISKNNKYAAPWRATDTNSGPFGNRQPTARKKYQLKE